MPPTTSKPAPKRKTPSFKPPRPASKSKKTTAAPRRKSAPTGKRGRPSLIADEASASDDDEDPDEEDEDDEIPSSIHLPSGSASPSDSNTPLPISTSHIPAATSSQDPPPTIPPALLTKLLHHHFKDSKMRIGKEANGMVGKYMETFVREAIARAAFERSEAVALGGVEAGVAGEFVEVEDLEKLAPQLLLDF